MLDYISQFTYDIIIGIFDIFLIFLLISLATKLFKELIKDIFNLKR